MDTKIEQDIRSEITLLSGDNLMSTSFKPIEGQYIIMLKKGTFDAFKPSRTMARIANVSGQTKEIYDGTIQSIRQNVNEDSDLNFSFDKANIKSIYSFAFDGFTAKLSSDELAELKKDARVMHIMQDRLISLAPPPGKGPGGGGDPEPNGQEIPWGITRVGGSGDGTGKTAWVIDSGIDLDHPDLNVDVARSVSFAGDNDPNDGNGHGTHVAGTIGALDNEIGVVGVAAGASLVALKVLDSNGDGQFSWTISALDYVAAFGSPGDAANMSLGPKVPYIDPLTDAATLNLASQGVKIAIAAGNEYDDSELYSPAHNNGNNIYTVSALADGDYFVWFSNYGTPVDYIAPGYNVKSSWLNGGYNTISGTSMASPHVCGLLLLGNINSDGTASDAYWEVKGQRATGKYSATDDFNRSAFRPDPDGISEPIAHR